MSVSRRTSPSQRRRPKHLWAILPAIALLVSLHPAAMSRAYGTPQGDSGLWAGAAARNIDPERYPVWVSGGIVAAKADRVIDSLHARSLVIRQGDRAIAICVVDSLAVPAAIVERAKEIVATAISIPADHILISATHAHSAPCVMGAHGTPVQDDYAEALPGWIAESIVEAHRRMQPAQIGYAVTSADRYIHCRHWIMEPGHANSVLFSGRDGDIAMMNPGHDNPFKIRQTNDVDRTIPVLSVQSRGGQPIAVLASFCTHYAGAPALSSDYFGVVARELASKLAPNAPDTFVGIMANGTSGDANCIDFSRPAKPFNHREVGHYVATRILDALPNIEYRQDLTVDAALRKLPLRIRQADAEELKAAQAYVASRMQDRLPANMEENYARETVLLSEWPATREIPIAALRIGDLAIAGYPNETFNDTGLAVRAQSPFPITLNIGLANDYAGYLPPAKLFPLGGYTTWRARTSCLEVDAETHVVQGVSELVHGLAAKHFTNWASYAATPSATSDSAPKHAGPDTAIPPEDSLSHFQLEPFQRIELAAAEPQAIDPVAMRFDDAGDMWIVEMSDYPNPVAPNAPPLGRVRVLRDEDLDGRYESVRTFAEGLLMPTGLQFYGDGVLVTVGGECLLLRDTDGDGRADDRSPILGGFAVENPQLRVNDPDLGPDMQYYLANGLRSSRADIAGQSLSIGNRDMRWDPRTRRAQAITGPSQFGMTWDRFGNRYFCSNRNPCDAVLLEAEWAAKSPLAGLAPLTESTLPAGERSTVHPRVSAWTTSNLHAGQFTAACGLLISDSRHLPFASLGNALTCEPTGSLVHRVGLGRANGRTYPEEPPRDREWLSSDDPWFRPVNLEEGPEGAIYIVDMHRAVIEHPDWVPEELKHRPDERWGEDCGRIYRVLRHDAPKLDPIFAELRARPLRTRSTAELIELMHHHNLWMRATAARILMDRDDSNMDAELVQACRRHPRSPGLLLTVNLLRQRGAWDRGLLELITECFDTPQSSVTAVSDPALRAGLWRACESFESWTLGMWGAAHGSFASREELLACLEGMPRVLSNSTLMWPMLVDAACEFGDDPHVLSGLAAFNRERLPQFTRAWMESARKRLQEKKLVTRFHSPSIRKLVASVAKPDDETWLATRQAWLEDAVAQATRTASDENERRAILEPSLRWAWAVAQGIAESPDRAWLGEQTVLWQGWVAQGLEGNLTEATRSEWLDLMGIAIAPDQSAQCAAALSAWIERNTDPALTQRALAAWSKHADASLTDWILEHFSSATPSIRGELFRALRAREDRLTAWLDALDRGEQSLQRLDASQLQSLQSVSGSLQPRIQKLLAGRISKDRQTVIDRVAPSIDLRGDRQRGKQLFAQHCASCHRIDDVGNAVGPDISDSRTQSPMQLLVAILDPNRTIDNNYFRVTVKMREGEVHDGIAIEESSQHLTLKNAQSPRLVLNKDEIESVRSSGISLMPEGIESQLDPAAMNDLISYIKQWRYVGDAAGIAK